MKQKTYQPRFSARSQLTNGWLGSTNLPASEGGKAWDAFVEVALSLLLKNKAVYIPCLGEFRLVDSEHKEVNGEIPYRIATRREATFSALKGVMVRFLQECEKVFSSKPEHGNERKPVFLEVERRKRRSLAGDKLSRWKYKAKGPRMDSHHVHDCPLPICVVDSSCSEEQG